MAEREGFEPPIGLHLCRISSAVHSTTLPPLLKAPNQAEARWSGGVLGEDGGPDKRATDKIRWRRGSHRARGPKGSWDRHTQAQIGGPKPQMLNPEVFRIRTCGAGQASDSADGDNAKSI